MAPVWVVLTWLAGAVAPVASLWRRTIQAPSSKALGIVGSWWETTVVPRFPRTTAVVASLWQRVRDEPLIGVALSLLLHVVVIALIVYLGKPGVTYTAKRGEPLFVELPDSKDQAPRGNPAAREPGPSAPPLPEPTQPAAKAEPAPVAKPTPPAPPKPPAPIPKVEPPATKAPPPAPKVAEAKPKPPEAQQVASTRSAEPARTAPAPKPPEPPAADAREALPTPPPEARPAPPAPQPAPPTPAPEARPTPVAQVASPQEPRPAPAAAPEPPRAAAPGIKVAVVPPPTREPVFNLKALGRGGGAGGPGDGRGGVEGEPVPLDSPDPKYSDYLDRVRRMIKDKWGFPCAEGAPDRYSCSRREGEMIIEFGIAKDGHVPFITLRQSTGSANMDAFALNAIKLASPFPPVPDVISKTGFPILARFRYILVDQSLTNVLR
jgi:TonB family protein